MQRDEAVAAEVTVAVAADSTAGVEEDSTVEEEDSTAGVEAFTAAGRISVAAGILGAGMSLISREAVGISAAAMWRISAAPTAAQPTSPAVPGMSVVTRSAESTRGPRSRGRPAAAVSATVALPSITMLAAMPVAI